MTNAERREAELRSERIAAARSIEKWVEIPAGRLVKRGRHFLVDAELDLMYTRRPGDVWEDGKASLSFLAPNAEVAFFVDANDQVVFLERHGTGTWSDVVARQRRRAKTAS